MQQSTRHPLPARAYAIAAAAVAVAAVLRWASGSALGNDLPLIYFVPAIVVAAMAGGMRLGLLTTLVGAVVGATLFMPHTESQWVAPGDAVRIALFFVAGGLASWLVTSSRSGWQRAAEAQRTTTERLRAEHARTAQILESIGDAFYAVDADLRFTYVNRKAEQLWGKKREELLGRRLGDEFAQAVGTEPYEMHLRVLRELQPVQFETQAPQSGAWLEVSLYPDTEGGLACYVRDIGERKRAEEALRAADKRKDEFLAVLGHELRNPLAPLRSGLELLERAGERPDLVANVRVMMQRQLAHLVHLVDDLLDLSRITHGEIQLQKTTVDLRTVVAAAVELSRPDIAERAQQLKVESPSEEVRVYGDVERLTQIVGNLLGNAAKYTPRGGTLTVATQLGGDEASVSVRDTGFGIPRERLEDIFEMFTQVPEHRAHLGGGGLGIGLALSRRLAELHGGTLRAASEGLGRGSVFTLCLPVATAGQLGAAAPEPRESTGSPQRRVLVVDDNVDAADSLRLVLELKGHVAEVAYDPRSALAAVPRFRPDCVLLDIGLPELDGYETAKRIRALPEGARLRLIAITGWGQEEDKQRARAAGFDAHLTKPVDFAMVATLLADHRPEAA